MTKEERKLKAKEYREQPHIKEKIRIRRRAYRKIKGRSTEKKHKYNRDKRLLRKYKISKLEYDKMLLEQNNCCKICFKNKNELKMNLAVDHCHITGKVRGLLCLKCNLGIGYFNDNIELLQNAIKYFQG